MNPFRAIIVRPLGDHRRGAFRTGFSLVELLVAIAVIGVLVAIALPAVQHARESARKVRCANHLHQIAVALQDHHALIGHLPVDGTNGYGIGALLLPHLDQSALYERLSPLTSSVDGASPARVEAQGTILPVFRCPSDRGSERLASGAGRSNYLGNAELFSQRTELTDVLDGESNTIAFGETPGDHAWALPGLGNCNAPPNSGRDFGSEHHGGAQFVLCDGAVRLISESIDARTFNALGTPAGNEPIGEF